MSRHLATTSVLAAIRLFTIAHPQVEIAELQKRFGFGASVVKRAIRGLRKRGTRSADQHPRWTGGRGITTQGYVAIYAPERGAARPYELEHRLVMEKHIGRRLTNKEIVHHINEIQAGKHLRGEEQQSRFHRGAGQGNRGEVFSRGANRTDSKVFRPVLSTRLGNLRRQQLEAHHRLRSAERNQTLRESVATRLPFGAVAAVGGGGSESGMAFILREETDA